MADGMMSPADLAAVTNGGEFGGGMGFFWIFALMILAAAISRLRCCKISMRPLRRSMRLQ